MKLKIKVKVLTEGCMPVINENGDWIDLRAAEDIVLKAPQAGVLKRKIIDGVRISHRDVTFDTELFGLGIAMELPKGFEAQVLPRSSTPRLGFFQPNSEAVIDNVYNGNNDEWKYWATALGSTAIHKGDRICQFRIQLSQKATVWQKIKWLLSSGIELVEVDDLGNDNRGGIGTSGIK